MIQINKFPKSKLLIEEIYLLGLMVTKKIDEAGANELGVFNQFINLQHSVYNLENCLYKLPKGVYKKRASTMKISINKFMERFFSYIDSFSTKDDPELIAAKEEILSIVNQYKATNTRSFDNLVKTNNVLADILHSDKYQPFVLLLNMNELLESLDTMNISANQLLSKKLTYNGLNQRIRRTDIVRNEVLQYYDKIVVRLNKLALVYKTDIYKSLFEWWNIYLDELRVQIDLRANKFKNDSIDDNIFENTN